MRPILQVDANLKMEFKQSEEREWESSIAKMIWKSLQRTKLPSIKFDADYGIVFYSKVVERETFARMLFSLYSRFKATANWASAGALSVTPWFTAKITSAIAILAPNSEN
jgi:hypothetical protein